MCASSVQMKNLSVFSSSCPVLVEPKDTEPTAKGPEHQGLPACSPQLCTCTVVFSLPLILLRFTGCAYYAPPFLISSLGLWPRPQEIPAFMHTPVLQLPGYVAVLVPSLLVQALSHGVNT